MSHFAPSASIANRADRAMWRTPVRPSLLTREHIVALDALWQLRQPQSGWRAVCNALVTPLGYGRAAAVEREVWNIVEKFPELIVRARVRDVAGFGWACSATLEMVGDEIHLCRADAVEMYERLTWLMHRAGDQSIDCTGAPPQWLARADPRAPATHD